MCSVVRKLVAYQPVDTRVVKLEHGLPAPAIPEVGLPALPGPPPLPGPQCVGFGTPIPFVGFSTC
jgi:hypothetical protein